ncbi:MAG: hypothetical protein DRQ47_02555 [Gammaproteobacteria bacterium]|nr:MAG: hypothetical protein DRQ47_02555 [Gammaproteobacteria bacterium]
MTISYNATGENQYTFTVKRITQLHELLSGTEKNLVNKFITEIRYSVTTYHKHLNEAEKNRKVKAHEQFFINLNDKAHKLARFTTELSILINESPSELFDEAKNADKAIDEIHGNLVNLCLKIDELSQQKSNFYHDAKMTVKDIYDAYRTHFNVTPSGKYFAAGQVIPQDTPIEDLLVPVVELLILKDRQRCHKLVKNVSH